MVGLINHVIDKVLVGAVDGIHDVGVGSVLCCFGGGSNLFYTQFTTYLCGLPKSEKTLLIVQKNLYYNIKIQI